MSDWENLAIAFGLAWWTSEERFDLVFCCCYPCKVLGGCCRGRVSCCLEPELSMTALEGQRSHIRVECS